MTRALLLLLLLIAFASACGPTVDLARGIQVEDLSTGWLDAGAANGMNKVVPAVTFRLKNVSDQQLPTLQVNAVFRRVTQNEEWGNGFRTVSGSGGLAPGAATDTLTITSQLGYTGTIPRDAMLRNLQFVDAKVDLFARYGSAQWTRIGQYPIARQLVERQANRPGSTFSSIQTCTGCSMLPSLDAKREIPAETARHSMIRSETLGGEAWHAFLRAFLSSWRSQIQALHRRFEVASTAS